MVSGLGGEVIGVAIQARDEASSVLDRVEGRVSRFGASSGAAMRALSGAAGALAGGAIGVLGEKTAELDNAMAGYAARAGVSKETTDALKDSILDLDGANLQNVESIATTMESLTTLQGIEATNEEQLKALTNQYLKFGTAAGVDAATAVADFDDILDAYGLTAEDALDIQDKLILSHQRFGTDVGGSTAALSKMAPALNALNLGVDDGIGLLNLFAASGVDASVASTAMTRAVAGLTDSSEAGVKAQTDLAKQFKMTTEETEAFLALEPAEKFQALIDKMNATTDPAQKAELAMALFGNRGGAAMATALGNAEDGLDEFIIKTEEAAGATEEAANKIESTFTNKLLMMKDTVVGGALSLTENLAPALMAVSFLGPSVTATIGAVTGAMGFMGAGVKVLGTVINATLLTPPTGVIVAIIAALALLVLAWQKNWFDIQGKTDAVLGYLGGIFGGFWEGLESGFNWVMNILRENWPEIATIISGPFFPLVALATDAFGIRTALVDAFNDSKTKVVGAWDAMAGGAKSALNMMIDYVNKFITRWNDLSFKVNIPGVGMVGVDTPDIPLIPRLAAGGVANEATLAMIGEAGPEAVVPLNRSGDFARFLTETVRDAMGGSGNNSAVAELAMHLRRGLTVNVKLSDDLVLEGIQ